MALVQAEHLHIPAIKSILVSRMAQEIEEISEDYRKSVKVLSAIDPIKAYYLSRRTNFEQAFQSFAGIAELIPAKSTKESVEIRQGVGLIVNTLKPAIFEESLKDLEVDIKSIAWKVGILTWYRSGMAIKRIKTSVERNMEKDLDQFIKAVRPQIEATMQAMQTHSTSHATMQPQPQTIQGIDKAAE